MKYWTEGSSLVMNIAPIVPGGRPLMSIEYKYNSRKVLGVIDTEGGGSGEPGDTYLSCFPDIYYNVSVRQVFCLHFLGRYYNSCNAIENHNRCGQLTSNDTYFSDSWFCSIKTT